MQNAFRRLGWEVRSYPQPREAPTTEDPHEVDRSRYRALQATLPRRVSSALRVWYSLRHDERSCRDLQRVLAQDRPTLIFEKYSSFQMGCARAACTRAVPYVVQFHAPAEESPHYHVSRRNAALLRRRMATVGKMATAVVAVSPPLRDYLHALGVPGDKILTLPNGVDLDLIAQAGSGASVRRKLGLASNALVIGFVGTMRPWQGYAILPEVLAQVRAKVGNAVFLLVGPFSDHQGKEEFEKQLVQHGVREDFLLTGAVPPRDVPAYIKAMDIAVMPDSTDYCSPMKLFEYGACARAVVMPRRAAILRILRDGDNGLLFHPSSPQDMAQKILHLAGRPELRDALGARLAQEVHAKYTYVRNVERILEHIGLDRPHVGAASRGFRGPAAPVSGPGVLA